MSNETAGQGDAVAGLPASQARTTRWWLRPAIYGLLLVVLDGLVLDQGALSLVVGLVLVVVYLPMSFIRKRHRAVLKQRLMRFGLYAGAVLLVFVIVGANGMLAARRADRLAAAVEEYKAKRGQYPKSLSDLVPEFMPGIPAAKINFSDTAFYYHAADAEHTLMYVAMPPFGRRIYRFEQRSWTNLD